MFSTIFLVVIFVLLVLVNIYLLKLYCNHNNDEKLVMLLICTIVVFCMGIGIYENLKELDNTIIKQKVEQK